jgi:DNA-binding transcriptional ArsR family regulator
VAVVQDPSLELKAKLFRGLADSSRLAILEALRFGEKMVTEVVQLTGLSQPNVSGHLICLKDCGLLTSRQEGRCVFYAIADARMATLMEVAEGILSGVSERIDCCSNYECKTAKKCVSGKKCSSTIPTTSLKPGAIELSLAEAVPAAAKAQLSVQVGQ